MPRVEWTRIGGNELEEMLAILLYREHPGATRIRASRGDGGIDVLIPCQGGLDVHQIKAFSRNLTSANKAQIRRSYKRLRDWTISNGIIVTRWTLMVPLDATKENFFTEFPDLVGTDSCPTQWKGLNACDALAAQFPEVIDYYLHGGRARLDGALGDMARILGRRDAGTDASTPIRLPEVADDLQAIARTLNYADPFFRYDIAVTTSPAIPMLGPRCVGVHQEGTPDGYVTVSIYACFDEAVKIRPIPLTVQIDAGAPGSEQRDMIEDFLDYGAPLDLRHGVTGEVDLPGGLGRTVTNATMRIIPIGDTQPGRTLRLQVIDPEDEVLAETRIEVHAATTGPRQTGQRAIAAEEHGTFSMEIRFTPTSEYGQGRFTFTKGKLAGTRPADVIAGLRVLEAMHHPNSVRIANLYGPVSHAGITVPDNAGLDVAYELALTEALLAIQEHTTQQLVMPDPETVTDLDCRRILLAGDLTRGELIEGTWDQFTFDLRADLLSEVTAAPMLRLRLFRPLIVPIAGHTVDLGHYAIFLASARLDRDALHAPNGDRVQVRVIPAANNIQLGAWNGLDHQPDNPAAVGIAF